MKYYISFIAVLVLSACSNSNTPSSSSSSSSSSSPVTFTGKLTYNRAIAIPSNARVAVLWSLSPDAGQANTYFQAAGTVDTSAKTFSLSFPPDPPRSALEGDSLGFRFGAGFVVLTTNAAADGIGSYDNFINQGVIYGAFTNSLIIFKSGVFPAASISGFPGKWPLLFQGYEFGDGHTGPDGMDTILPVDKSKLELLVDTSLSAFRYPNFD